MWQGIWKKWPFECSYENTFIGKYWSDYQTIVQIRIINLSQHYSYQSFILVVSCYIKYTVNSWEFNVIKTSIGRKLKTRFFILLLTCTLTLDKCNKLGTFLFSNLSLNKCQSDLGANQHFCLVFNLHIGKKSVKFCWHSNAAKQRYFTSIPLVLFPMYNIELPFGVFYPVL